MSRTNALSAFGRMGWGTHFLIYPISVGLYFGVYSPYKAKANQAVKDAEMAAMAKAKVVDPDYFNPFTPIPFHNNPELKYVFAEINMRKYVNENHINVKDYQWKNYHDSYDHGNKKTYLYNWTSV
jgi:hypothetical protein